MTYPNDFQVTFPMVIEEGGNSIDSYALLTSIISVIENYKIQFHLDNSLPLINGDCESLKELFKGFLVSAVDKFKEHDGTLHIIYRKDLESSFLAFFIKDLIPAHHESNISNLVDVVDDFNFAIYHKPLDENEYLKNSPFLN